MHTGMILIDLQKTFDILDYKTHFEKMTCLDFKTPVTENFEYNLSNKLFFVSVDDFFLGDWKFTLFLKGLFSRYFCFSNISMTFPSIFQKMNIIFMHMISSYETKTLTKLKLFLTKNLQHLANGFVLSPIFDILLSPSIFLFFDDFKIFSTVVDSYNARIDSYNCRRQLSQAN